MSDESDEILMRRLQAGDARAFDALLERRAEAVRGRLAAICRDHAAAEDLLQEVFLRLWTRAEQWTGQGTVAGWLMRIATNLALNHLRTRRHRPHRPPPGPPSDEHGLGDDAWPADDAPNPADLLERAEMLESLRRSVDALPEAKRAVMKLIHEEELDIATVADRLGIPEGTVKSRLHYAIRRLARELGEPD